MTLKEKFIKKWISSDSHLEWNDDYTELKNEAKIDLDELLRETAEAQRESDKNRIDPHGSPEIKILMEVLKMDIDSNNLVISPNTGDKK